MKNLTNIYISLFYSGYFKIWPGTFGSLISIFILFPFIEFKLMSLEKFYINKDISIAKTIPSDYYLEDAYFNLTLKKCLKKLSSSR